MKLYLDSVAAFHNKIGNKSQPFNIIARRRLVHLGEKLIDLSNGLEEEACASASTDPRALRAHLMLEELGECLAAMGHGNEVEALDGLTDLLYVVLGTAVTFDWPLEAAFAEIQASNMTKEKQPGDRSAVRIRQKGAGFKPPNLRAVLELHHKHGEHASHTNWSACVAEQRREALQGVPKELYDQVLSFCRKVAAGRKNALEALKSCTEQ